MARLVRHSRERGCEEIGTKVGVAVVHASRCALRALLSMRYIANGIEEFPQPEEAAPSRRRLRRLLRTRRLSRRPHGADPAPGNFFTRSKAGIQGGRFWPLVPWTPASAHWCPEFLCGWRMHGRQTLYLVPKSCSQT